MIETILFKEKVEMFYKKLLAIEYQKASIKLSDDKWSLCEIIGHLIDSASNNHQRFVRLQFCDLLDFPAYDTEPWVSTQKYHSMNWEMLITLWYSYNYLILHIIENIDETKLKNVWVKGEESLTLEFLISDYYSHMDLHIEHFKNRLEELNIA